MIFHPSVGKGVKKRSIGHPNPREIPRIFTLDEVIQKGLEMYFKTENIDLSDTSLADSDGIVIELDDSSCTLESYFTRNEY